MHIRQPIDIQFSSKPQRFKSNNLNSYQRKCNGKMKLHLSNCIKQLL